MTQGPVVFDLEHDPQPAPKVSDAAPVPEAHTGEGGDTAPAAMARMAVAATRRPSRVGRWFWRILLAVLAAVLSVAAWDFATGLIDRIPVLGWMVSAGLVLALALALIMILREGLALARLRRIDDLRQAAIQARSLAAEGPVAVQAFQARLVRFYAHRSDLSWHRARLAERSAELIDGDTVLDLIEDELLAPLDARALAEVEATARQVALVTALVPLALADVVVALVASVRMIRRVAEIYGGRSGLFGSWRLMRTVLAHLAATGAIAAGEDMLDTVLGGSVLSKLSRRFGEGVVNGALSARVGIAAMEVCRPMPFSERHRPATRKVIKGALSGLFSRSKSTEGSGG
ncbi:TIGR01620 family protein [Phaeobacter sp. QD34_3]|uniref:YcjF family protein n=1 Tax=unclassified Phaeobacter TaxID=2621772 RepID=UPI00237EEB00|nr:MULTISPECIES: TIGR01620 family protein [unclassified Phaeobacter]MDE4132734.1 TIGR01620 family protein [Phaeobacter sp. QD34_3]MDE4136473.1 TIGR01620 family protein [Phaeobacter sp. QD34_24]